MGQQGRANSVETPEALEKQIHRIHERLERSPQDVTWNDHVPDPDNPEQLRQIDITIRRNGIFTIIECRLSKRAQNVKWIEELIGRRQSLGADTIIAVASAGFTIGAKKKAARYGVLLLDLRDLSDEDWGGQITLMLYYYQYSDVKLAVAFAPHNPDIDPAVLKPELRSHGVLQSLFNAAAEQLDSFQLLPDNDTRTYRVSFIAYPEMVELCGEPVLQIGFEGKGRLVSQPISSPQVFGYGEPTQVAGRREATVERYDLGETSSIMVIGSR